MNARCEERWNALVGPQDMVYYLGDFALQRDDQLVRNLVGRLHGTIHLVRGNHDKRRSIGRLLDLGFATVQLDLTMDGFHLVHHPPNDPLSVWVPPTLCGHVHGAWKHLGRCLNVGVDVWDFCPIPWDLAVQWRDTLRE